MRSLDATLVIPADEERVYQKSLGTSPAKEPPVFGRWVASYLLRRGYGVDIIDQAAEELTSADIAKRISDENPTLVVAVVYGTQPSASTQNMPAARALCQAIKNIRPDVPIIVTGTHIAALPERTLREEPVDFVCDGEGPITIHELLEALKEKDCDYSKVRGLWYKKDDKYVKTSPAPLITNLNLETACEAWDLVPPKRYVAHDWHCNYGSLSDRMPYASIMTTFGCPYRCSFCCIQAPFKSGESTIGYRPEVNSYRFWNPENVIKEIGLLVNDYGVTNFKFHDEMFVLNPSHVRNICRLITERFGDRLNIWAYTRVDTTRPEFLDILRGAGFKWLGVGIESASSKVRDGQDKDFDDNDIYQIVERIHNAGINVAANYIFGLPYDTLETMQATLDMAISLNTVYANLYCAMAYPGSALYGQSKQKSIALPDDPNGPGWIGYSQHAYETLPAATDSLTAAQVLAFRDDAWLKYYMRPDYLEMLKTRLGNNAEKAVEYWSRPHRLLRRKILESSSSH